MQLRQAVIEVLKQYPSAMGEPFAGHPVAQLLRQQLPEAVRDVTDRVGDFLVAGSAGQGNWTNSPWVAIFDPLITESAQRGFYPVYLFREDLSGLYLSLNQGVTDVKLKYASKAKDALRARAIDFRARLGPSSKTFPLEKIDLRPASQSSLSADYEAGNVIAKLYDAVDLSDEQTIIEDLLQMLALYRKLTTSDPDLDSAAIEDDEQGNKFDEDHTKLSYHKRIERNPNVSRAVKKAQGYVCKACGFDFRAMYPGVEQNEYIEAHHLIPISQLKGQKVSRDPVTDFAVLCANCHRMIHRCASTSDLEAFKALIRVRVR